MEAFLIKAAQLLLSLSILVFLHELGHFAFARLFKTRVDKFYLFFNWKISLVRAKKVNGKWQVKFLAPNVPYNERPKVDEDGYPLRNANGERVMEPIPLNELPDDDWRKYPDQTEWGIGWIPLGGYCKIAGMVDESMDTTQMQQEPQSWEYRSKPIWQRMFIISGGVLVNFLLALVIYSAVLFTWGKEYMPLENAKYGLEFSQTLLASGFENGDNIVAINGEPVERSADVIQKILIEGKQNVDIVRNGETLSLKLPGNLDQTILASGETNFISIRYPFVLGQVADDSPAQKAGLQKEDSIVGINGKSTFIFQEIARELDANKGQTVSIEYVRDGITQTASVQLSEDGKLGVGLVPYFELMPTKVVKYAFFESIPAGINLGVETLSNYVKQFRIIFSKEGAKQLGGFGTIGSLFAPVWDWHSFWTMTAFLSIILAFMNFLPIPALDGGHFVFLLYEAIVRRKPSEKFMEYAQMIGFFLLIGLVLFANGNDIFRAIKNLFL